jgi:alkyldihydroxyacetonephosphate synthase
MNLADGLAQIVPADRISVLSQDIDAHSYDSWPVAIKWRQQGKQPSRPDAVVRPQTTAEVACVLRWANETLTPITPWGAGSAVTGACLTEYGGVTVDLEAMNATIAIDEVNLMVTAEAGKRGDVLEAELNARGFTLNHSPQSLDRSTIGGWVATRATGQFSSRYGGIEDLLISLKVVLPSGEIVNTKRTPRAAIGLDTKELFIGSEGTLGIVTEVTVKIFPLAKHRIFQAITFPSVHAGLDALRRITRDGIRPFLARFYDEDEARHAMVDKAFSSCVMFLGFEGNEIVASGEFATAIAICSKFGGTPIGDEAVRAWMARRFDFSAIENILKRPSGVAETIEIVDFWDSIEGTYNELKTVLAPLADEVLGHFSHIYNQGTSLYVILIGEADDAAASEKRLREIWDAAMQVCLRRGAAISHHHGIGLARLPYVVADVGDAMNTHQQIKRALDPHNIMNKGKLGLAV